MSIAKVVNIKTTVATWTTNSSVSRVRKAGLECALKSADTEINSEGRKNDGKGIEHRRAN